AKCNQISGAQCIHNTQSRSHSTHCKLQISRASKDKYPTPIQTDPFRRWRNCLTGCSSTRETGRDGAHSGNVDRCCDWLRIKQKHRGSFTVWFRKYNIFVFR
ncbi:hypothetical protein PENTCL1PPCAC_16292, partial [Pristionchus entomophagus]